MESLTVPDSLFALSDTLEISGENRRSPNYVLLSSCSTFKSEKKETSTVQENRGDGALIKDVFVKDLS